MSDANVFTYVTYTLALLTVPALIIGIIALVESLSIEGGEGGGDLSLGSVTADSMTIDNSGGTGVTLPSATSTSSGLMSANDKVKVDSFGSTDLSLGSVTTQTVTVDSSSGTGVILPAATLLDAGVMTAEDKNIITNITSIEVGNTVYGELENAVPLPASSTKVFGAGPTPYQGFFDLIASSNQVTAIVGPSPTVNGFTIQESGDYSFAVDIAFEPNNASTRTLGLAAFVNGTIGPRVNEVVFSTTDSTNVTFTGVIPLLAGQDVDFRVSILIGNGVTLIFGRLNASIILLRGVKTPTTTLSFGGNSPDITNVDFFTVNGIANTVQQVLESSITTFTNPQSGFISILSYNKDGSDQSAIDLFINGIFNSTITYSGVSGTVTITPIPVSAGTTIAIRQNAAGTLTSPPGNGNYQIIIT